MIITKEKELILRFVVFALKTVDWGTYGSMVTKSVDHGTVELFGSITKAC
jgi:hypothetical protein